MISGMYLGEIVRNILLHLIDQPPVPATTTTPAQYHLFDGHSCKALNTHYGLDTAFMSDIAEASSSEKAHALVVQTFGFEPTQVTFADAEIIKFVCMLVARRAAALSACGVAAVLIQARYAQLGGASGEKPLDNTIDIGVDGSLVEFYPGFETMLREALVEIVGKKVEQAVRIGLAKDGSGVGAALCALVAMKQEGIASRSVEPVVQS